MKLKIVLMLCVLPALVHAENLLKNSDMSTSGAWRGERKFVEDGGNKVLKLEADDRDHHEVEQEIRVSKFNSVEVKLRYKTSNYTGAGITLKTIYPNGGSTWTTLKNVKTDGAWHSAEWSANALKGNKTVVLSVGVLPGSGEILFDDIEAKGK